MPLQSQRFDFRLRWLLLFAVVALTASCGSRDGVAVKGTSSSPAATVPPQPTPIVEDAKTPEPKVDRKNDQPIDVDGYRVELVKAIRKEPPNSGIRDTEIQSAVLKKGNSTVMKFNGTYNPPMNFIYFRVVELLGDGTRQIYVNEQTNRNGRTWIVSLKPKPHVIFDSKDFLTYQAAFEEDVDDDGVFELSSFVESEFNLSSARAGNGRPLICFKYDRKADRFLPAGRLVRPPDPDSPNGAEKSLSRVLSEFGTLVFAGRDDEAWAYFEREWRDDLDYMAIPESRNRDYARKALREWMTTNETYLRVKRSAPRNFK